MRKFWAIVCVVGFTGFWTFGFIAASGAFGDRPFDWLALAACLAGLIVGTVARLRVVALTRHVPVGPRVRPQEGATTA
jgi:hypothetical protein